MPSLLIFILSEKVISLRQKPFNFNNDFQGPQPR